MTLPSKAPCTRSCTFSQPAPTAALPPVGSPGGDTRQMDTLMFTLVVSLAEAFELDERERAIARMLLRDHDVPMIAGRLELSLKMTAWQVQDVYAKTGTDCARGLLRLALRLASARERVDAPVRVMRRWSNVNAPARAKQQQQAQGMTTGTQQPV